MEQNDIKTKQSQPWQLYMLSMTEVWERFGYYGMRALLTLFMVNVLLFDKKVSYDIFGAFVALVYFTPFAGGVIADKLLGFSRSILVGGILMAVGYFIMALATEASLFAGLACVAIGNGFFKPNVSSILGTLYTKDDSRRDSGFTVFYMGINIGGFIAPLACTFVQAATGSWGLAFATAGAGMLVGIITFLYTDKKMEGRGLPNDPEYLRQTVFGLSREVWVYVVTALVIPIVWLMLYYNQYTKILLTFLGTGCYVYLLYYAFTIDVVARQKLFAALTLMIFSVLFFSCFDMAGTALTIFADTMVNRTMFGFDVPASVMVALNPFFVVALGAVFAALWVYLAKRGQEPSTPFKFVLAMVAMGLGFGSYWLGLQMLDEKGLVPFLFLVLGYFWQTVGELCLSPVGLSMVTKLSPKEITAMIMGGWMLSWSFANIAASELAKATAAFSFESVFLYIAIVSVIIGLLLVLIVPTLRRWMHGIH